MLLHMHGGNLFHSVGMQDGSVVAELIPERGQCTTGYQFNMCLKHVFVHVPVDGDREGAYSTLRTEDMEVRIRTRASKGIVLKKKTNKNKNRNC